MGLFSRDKCITDEKGKATVCFEKKGALNQERATLVIDCNSLTYRKFKVKIGKGVTTIKSNTFFDRNQMTSVEFEKGCHLKEIGDRVFCKKELLKKVTFGEKCTVETIGISAFSSCPQLREIKLPEGVKKIYSDAFSYCYGLSNVELPKSVSSMGESVFISCENLVSVKLDADCPLEALKKQTFAKCKSLERIESPKSVKQIEEEAFLLCESLQEIIIPAGVTIMGKDVFRGCNSLTIYCEAEKESEGWQSGWNPQKRPVIWGYKKTRRKSLI